jgi:hypothetical protein
MILKEWVIKHSEQEATNREHGAEMACSVRLSYECPWELQD